MTSVLLVCLGNICRSPMAEGALRQAAAARGLDLLIDSAGTGGWHAGDPPDARAMATARAHGVDISGLRGRVVQPEDFRRFDLIVALDRANLRDLRAVEPYDSTAQLSLLLDHVPGRTGQSVADPYTGDLDDFALTWAEVSVAAEGLLDWIETT
ncbi:MAG: low molecular weight phosphotyrosine protein phosphatase [Caulobacterales bacterium]|nr:low molecular weight phosphotyrosine protein phosphatase [Caulobacterales bacterium]